MEFKNTLIRSYHKFTYLLIAIFCCGITVSAQSVKRQVIGAMGTTYHGETLSIQHSTGQPYQTKTRTSDSEGYFPGFIQPTSYHAIKVDPVIASNINVYPNPASDQVAFKDDGQLTGTEIFQLRIYDQTGRMIKNEQVTNLSGYRLDCSDWTNGLYLIDLRVNSGEMLKSRLIVSK